jgi:hypothetical protein
MERVPVGWRLSGSGGEQSRSCEIFLFVRNGMSNFFQVWVNASRGKKWLGQLVVWLDQNISGLVPAVISSSPVAVSVDAKVDLQTQRAIPKSISKACQLI